VVEDVPAGKAAMALEHRTVASRAPKNGETDQTSITPSRALDLVLRCPRG